MGDSEIYDVVIIGAGPAGMTAALFAQNKKLRVLVVEGARPGGQLKNLYPYKPVYNYPGYSQIPAGKLADRMVRQVQENHIPILDNAPVQTVEPLGNGLFVLTGPTFRAQTRAIILACGLGLYEPRRLNIPGEQELENDGVYYAVTDLSSWAGKKVAVIGGGNAAVDNALLLAENGSEVTIIHQLLQFQAEPASVEKLQQAGIPCHLGWKVDAFRRTGDGRIELEMRNPRTGASERLLQDRVLINIGLKPSLDFIQKLPVEKNGRHVKVDSEMRTSVPGIFACGDVVSYPGKVRLIVTAIGEAATAVNSLQQYLKSAQIPERESVHDEGEN